VELESLKFFESSMRIQPDDHLLRCGTRFPQRSARLVNVQLTMRNRLYRQRREIHPVKVRYFRYDGYLLKECQTELVIESDQERASYRAYCGNGSSPGYWTAGVYRVEVLIDGVKCAEESFTIDEDHLQLESLRFYESGRGIPAKGTRRYSDRFDQRTTRYMNFEINARNLLHMKGDQTYHLAWRYYMPDGNVMGLSGTDGVIMSDRASFEWSAGRGWEEAGHWIPGTYRVEILLDGVKFAEGSFTIW
jgi:hypothetical protein